MLLMPVMTFLLPVISLVFLSKSFNKPPRRDPGSNLQGNFGCYKIIFGTVLTPFFTLTGSKIPLRQYKTIDCSQWVRGLMKTLSTRRHQRNENPPNGCWVITVGSWSTWLVYEYKLNENYYFLSSREEGGVLMRELITQNNFENMHLHRAQCASNSKICCVLIG